MDELDQSLLIVPEGYLQKSAVALLDDFGAGKAAPGSGSAAALMGLLAAKLVMTVCDVTIRNRPDDSEKFGLLRSQAEARVPRLKELFEKDAREFDEHVEIRKKRNKPGIGPQEKRELTVQGNEKLEDATDNVFEIMDICLEIIEFGKAAFDGGSPHVRGDSGAAMSVSVAAVSTGLFVVALNLDTLKDRAYGRENTPRCAKYREKLVSSQAVALSRVVSLSNKALDEFAQLNLFAAD